MSVIDDIESGKAVAYVYDNVQGMPQNHGKTADLLHLAKIGAARQWVPVAEGLPEERKEVLGWMGDCYCLVKYVDGYWFDTYGVDDTAYPTGIITHWQPLPPLPGSG